MNRRSFIKAAVSVVSVYPWRGAIATPSFRWGELERHSANPVLRAVPNSWEAIWFVVDSVIEAGGEYRMYYSAAVASDKKTSKLGLATSRDGVTWERHKANPIWQNAWHNFLRDVRVRQFGPEDFWIYYSDGDRHLDLARSTDGIHWTNYAHNPILKPSQAWEDLVMQPSVLKTGDTWRMWYSTYGRKPRVTGCATSTDGIHWNKHAANPVLPLGSPGEWDDYSAFQPAVFEQDGCFHMIYTGSCKANETGYRLGYAWSKNGLSWTKSPQNPIVAPGAKGAWDGGKISCPTLLRTGPRTFNIYYSGARTPTATYEGIGLVRAQLEM